MANSYGHSTREDIAVHIPADTKRLLDIGCNTGGFGYGLKQKRNIEVWGVEPDREAANHASKFLDKVLCEPFDSTSTLPDHHFDVVVFNDVLEHFADPWAAIRTARPKLRRGGCIVASIPNFLHKDNLIHILKDRDFQYEPTGIRDRTHLRFFTKKSAVRLFSECGFEVLVVSGINESWWTNRLLDRIAYRFFAKQLYETKFIQFVYVAKPANDGDINQTR